MIIAQTTREQAKVAAETGQALFAFACTYDGVISADGPISHELACHLTRLMTLVVADRVDADKLQSFVDTIDGGE